MIFLSKLYLRFSWLSLDVVFGALAGQVFFSKLLRVELSWPIFLLLAMAVWSIYTLDHLLDVRNKSQVLLSPRHQFHLKHQLVLSVLSGIVILGGLGLAYETFGWNAELTWSLILGGLILSSMVIVRRAGKKLVWLKELSIAVFYVIGIAWIPLLRVEPIDLTWQTWIMIGSFTLLALVNLLMLSHSDRKQDELSDFPSSAQLFTPLQYIELIRRLSFLLLLLVLATFILFPSYFRPFSAILIVMTLVHYLAFFNPVLSKEQVRIRTEAAFMLPLVLLFL